MSIASNAGVHELIRRFAEGPGAVQEALHAFEPPSQTLCVIDGEDAGIDAELVCQWSKTARITTGYLKVET